MGHSGDAVRANAAPNQRGLVPADRSVYRTLERLGTADAYTAVFPVKIAGVQGAALTSSAFENALPGFGGMAVAVCLTFFAFTTAMSWCVYGERCAIYFFGDKAQWPFRVVYCLAIPVGVLTQLDLVWLLADTCNALMAFPNLVAIAMLSPVIFKIVRENEAAFRAECDKK